jgi:hypothetical protein
MSNVASTTIPPAWYADPADASMLRWWDGAAWTARVADRPVAIPTPAPAPQLYEAPRLPQRRGWSPPPLQTNVTRRGSQTVSSWLLATAILWVGIPGSFIGAFVATAYPAAAPVADVLMIGLIELGLARLDGNRLEAQGYQRPSSAWALFLTPVYFIIRTVRVGGGGIVVMIVHILALAVGIIILTGGFANLMAGLGF